MADFDNVKGGWKSLLKSELKKDKIKKRKEKIEKSKKKVAQFNQHPPAGYSAYMDDQTGEIWLQHEYLNGFPYWSDEEKEQFRKLQAELCE